MSLFSDLLDFIQNRMRMSRIYQPVMLTTLLRNDGAASERQIAQQFAERDEALIEYYSKITRDMPGRVLGRNHGIVTAIRGDRNSIISTRRRSRGNVIMLNRRHRGTRPGGFNGQSQPFNTTQTVQRNVCRCLSTRVICSRNVDKDK